MISRNTADTVGYNYIPKIDIVVSACITKFHCP